MIRISLPYIFGISSAFEPLYSLKPGPYKDIFFYLLNAQNQLDELFNNSVFSTSFRMSKELADKFKSQLKYITDNRDFERDINQYELFNITNSYTQFKTAFLAELGVFPSYFVTQKGGFDTITLLDNAERIFPNELVMKVPEAFFDLREAGKALAFELSSACGFHVFRAVESVLRRYYISVSDGKAEPKQRNIGVYIRSMKQHNLGDEKIISALEHLKDLHRNPLIHPEVALTLDEASSLMGMARSVITAMLSALPFIPPTTTSQPSLSEMFVPQEQNQNSQIQEKGPR